MKRKRLTIKDMHDLATKRAFKFLSKEFTIARAKYKWECSKGHIWEATAKNIKNNSGCPVCYGHQKTTMKDVHKLAQEKNITCLSQAYVNRTTKLKWACQCGYKWELPFLNMKKRNGCPECFNCRIYTIKDMHLLAQKRNIEFISDIYTKTTDKHLWRCKDGHVWSAAPYSVQHNHSGCPKCKSTYLSEEKCRFIFEQLTLKKFPKTRGVLGGRYELDGYCKELKLAFEYNGRQHYEFVPQWHKTEKGLEDIKATDKLKTILCQNLNIQKINIPFHVNKNKNDNALEGYIRNHINSDVIKSTAIDWSKFKWASSKLQEIKEFCKLLNFECLSKVYTGMSIPVKWRCSKGHVWKTSPANIKSGTRCPNCAGKAKKTIKDMKQLAVDKGFKFMSDNYTNVMTKSLWQCKNGHHFMASPNGIQQGKRCPKCPRK